jgi:hypothetical protein
MTSDDLSLDIQIGTGSFPDLAMGESGNNILSPFEFIIPETYESRIDSFFFDITANGGTYQVAAGAEANIGKPQLLIVDDDDGDNLQNYLGWPLYYARTPSITRNKKLEGSPDVFELAKYHTVLWLTGEAREEPLTVQDMAAIQDYLDIGGNLFLTGQGLAEFLNAYNPNLLNNYFKADYINETQSFIPVLGATDGPISVDMNSIVIAGTSGANNQSVYEHILPVNGGIAEWFYLGTSEHGAVSFSGDFKTVFFSFGFEAIESDDARFETQATVLSRILDFFGDLPTDVGDPGHAAAGLPTRFSLNQNYPNPFNPITTISYVITGAGPRLDNTRLDIINILGQHIKTLVDRDEVPGQYSITWDGRDETGREVASGLYFYRLTRGNQDETKKMLLLK